MNSRVLGTRVLGTWFILLMLLANAFALSLDAFSVANGNEYATTDKPTLYITASDANASCSMYFSCDGTTYTDVITFAETYSDFNFLNSFYGCTQDYTEGMTVTVYAKIGFGDFNTAALNDAIKFDVTAPAAVAGFGITDLNNGTEIDLNWTANTENDLNYYNIYRHSATFTDTSSATLIDSNSARNSFHATGLTAGSAYYFAVVALDYAGNFNSGVTPVSVIVQDFVAPANANSPVIDANGSQSVSLSWVKNTDTDTYKYVVWRGITSSAVDAGSVVSTDVNLAVGTMLQSACGALTCEFTDSNAVVNDSYYYYRIYAVDASDNNSALTSIVGPALPVQGAALGAPTVSSSSHATADTWYATKTINVSWTAVTDATYYSYALDSEASTVPDTTNDTTETSYSVQKDSGTYYFHIRACNDANCGATTHRKILVDATAPSQPSGVTAETNTDGTVTVSWTASTDAHSGVKEYVLYKGRASNFGVTDTGVESFVITAPTISYIVEGLSEGKNYYFKLKAVDNVGNNSSLSAQTSARVEGICDVTITLSLNGSDNLAYATAGDLKIEVVADGGKIYNSVLKAKMQGEGYETLVDDASGTSTITKTYTIASGKDGTAEVNLYAEDALGNNCSKKRTFKVDTVAPELEFSAPEENAEVSGSVELKATATDSGEGTTATGMQKVTFYYKSDGEWINISSVSTATNDVFSYIWDSDAAEYYDTELKAEAKDLAGNKTEKVIKVTVEGKPAKITATEETGPTPESTAETAISEAQEKATELDALIERLASQNLSIEEHYTNLQSFADANLSQAETEFSNDNFESSKALAEKATELFTQIIKANQLSVYSTQTYSFDTSKLVNAIKGTGLKGETASKSAQMIQTNLTGRNMQIIEAKDDLNNSIYHANIILTFTNESNEEKEIQIIEVIPKEFAASAAELYSNLQFEIIEGDPIIKFIAVVPAGEELEIVYGLKNLAKETADAFTENKVLEQFSSPPIVLPVTETISSASFSETPKAEGIELIWILLVILLLVVSVVGLLGGVLIVVIAKDIDLVHDIIGTDLLKKKFPKLQAKPKAEGLHTMYKEPALHKKIISKLNPKPKEKPIEPKKPKWAAK